MSTREKRIALEKELLIVQATRRRSIKVSDQRNAIEMETRIKQALKELKEAGIRE